MKSLFYMKSLNRYKFNKNKLLDGYESSNYPFIILNNDYVEITMRVYSEKKIILENFYKRSKDIGITRCALLALLEKIINNGVSFSNNKMVVSFTNNTIVEIDSVMPSDRNYIRLIKMYTDMGFKKISGNIKDVVMQSNIGRLIQVLNKQCEFEVSGGKLNRKTRRKNKRNTKTKKMRI